MIFLSPEFSPGIKPDLQRKIIFCFSPRSSDRFWLRVFMMWISYWYLFGSVFHWCILYCLLLECCQADSPQNQFSVQNFWPGNTYSNISVHICNCTFIHLTFTQLLFLECLLCARNSAKHLPLLFVFSLSKGITNLQLIKLVKNAMILPKIMQFSGPQTLEFHRAMLFFLLGTFY